MCFECHSNVFYKGTAVLVTYLKWDFEVVFLPFNVLNSGLHKVYQIINNV